MNIPAGIGTKFGVIFALLLAAKPTIDQVVALVENTSAHWNTGDKISLVSGAVIALGTIGGRFGQAIAKILKGG